MHVLQSPAFDAPIEPTWKQVNNVLVRVHRHVTINNRLSHIYVTYVEEIRSVLACHTKAKVPPESCVFLYHLFEMTMCNIKY